MRLIKMTGLLAATAMTLGVFGVAAARTGSVLSSSTSVFGAPAAAVEAPREVDLPPEQQLSLAHGYLAKMDQGTTTVRAALEQARAARDVVKTLCLNDKLNQIDVATRSGKERATTLQSAVSAHDRDRARHEFMILQVLKDRVEQLVKEANQCIGEEAGFIGESLVSLTVDPNIPDNNTDQLGNDPEIISEPPVLASPLM
jgi:hypothetical protein